MKSVRTGMEVWASQGFSALRGMRVGAIVNPTSVDSGFRHLADHLAKAEGVKLKALFGPEHGVRGELQYMEPIDGAITDAKTGLPVYSLYGSTLESLTPTEESLQGLDALVFDIQDVGARYYTYVYTMALAMKAAAKAGVAFYVLDRPNPINGVQVEGNLVGEAFRSFVGLFKLPNRHGMTAGELAQLFNQEEKFGCDLEIVKCENWERNQYFETTGLPFIPPSPNMPTTDTALVYPGMCLGEGTNCSEGRGTCRPFEQFGAPWIRSDPLIESLDKLELPGVKFRPVSFVPTFDKYAGTSCAGAMIHVTDRAAFKSLLTGIAIFKVVHDIGGEHFAWREDAYEFVKDVPAFDLLCGTDQVRKGILAGASLEALTSGFDTELKQFLPTREKYQIYA